MPATGLGVASGGLSAEGFLYGESLGNLEEALLALHTARYHDTTLAGPQAALVQSPYWDRFVDGFLQSITPTGQTPTDPSYTFMGPVYQMSSYGDILDFWIPPEFVTPFATLGVLDQTTGNGARLPALRWIAQNAIQGGAGDLYNRAANVWGNSYASQSILYYMLFDPTAAAPADPRPGRPLVFSDPAIHRVIGRTDWTPNATVFDYLCNWQTINHQVGSANEFELYRKGEWLTKERTGYSNDEIFMTSDYHNTLAVQNDTPASVEFFETETSARGGQWTNGDNAGDPNVLTSNGAGWVYAYGETTNLYNRPNPTPANAAMDITHVSRSIVWMEPDHVFVYDRATSKTANRFKRFNLTFLANPVIAGHTATVTSAAGQRLTIDSLLPASGTLTASAAEAFDRVADLEPTKFRLVVEDPTHPADVRFLHVLEAADAGVAAGTATLVESSSGTPFAGAAVAGTVVMFPVDPSATFTGTSFVAPAGTTLELVGGLTPGAGYTVSTQAAAGGTLVTVTPGGSAAAAAGGVLVVSGSAQPPPPPPPPSCTFALSASSASFAAAGGTGTVSVTAGAGCAWTAQSSAVVDQRSPAGQPGTAAGSVAYAVAANTATAARTATLTIGGQAFTVTQAAATTTGPCAVTLPATSASFSAAGGTSSRPSTRRRGLRCGQASRAGPRGSGRGEPVGSGHRRRHGERTRSPPTRRPRPRTGVITVGGQTFTVTQAVGERRAPTGPCAVSLPVSDRLVLGRRRHGYADRRARRPGARGRPAAAPRGSWEVGSR